MVGVIAGALIGPAPAAHADPNCDTNMGSAECGVQGQTPGNPSDPRDGSTKPRLPSCPPAAGAVPKAQGKPAGRGEWVLVTCRKSSGGNAQYWVSVDAAGNPGAVDPAVLARSLLARMRLYAITPGITPLSKAPDSMGLVGLPVWLWVESPTRSTWGPSSIAAGGISMTAKVESITWEMGDGTRLSCGQGTEWTPARGAVPSPTCGHVYDQQGTFRVRAISHWAARWSGYGQSGVIRFDLTRSWDYRVAEIQVVRQR